MAKIVVYEDDGWDAIKRYSELINDHEVHIRIPGSPMYGLECRGELEDAGFQPDFIHDNYGEPSEEIADIYFVDGLGGLCKSVLSELPIDKSILYSDDNKIENKMRELGYTVADASVTKMVERFLSRDV